jgi:3-hydroxyisobutyrate dehydrogenase/2-hydroxy-3-oxopropionate reductase
MGSRMAARLRAAGHTVVTRAELASAKVAVVMVPDAVALRGITHELAAAPAVIVMATVGRAAVAELRAAVPGRVVDAPVLGSIAEAEAGTLVIFADSEEWDELLGALGEVVHVADGQAAKLVANDALLAAVVALGEALALAERVGLSREAAFDVLARTPLAGQAERRRRAVEAGSYDPRFRLSLARKDADLIAAAVPELPLAASVRGWFAAAEEHGRGDADYTAVLAEILDRSS